MVTKQQAADSTHFHRGVCTVVIGPRGAVRYHVDYWRKNGNLKTWITRPNEFRLPIKTGFMGPCDYITQSSGDIFHTHEDCIMFRCHQCFIPISREDILNLQCSNGHHLPNIIDRRKSK